LIVHEIEHQAQYQSGGTTATFDALISESKYNLERSFMGGPTTYFIPGKLEYKAQQVQRRALNILRSRR